MTNSFTREQIKNRIQQRCSNCECNNDNDRGMIADLFIEMMAEAEKDERDALAERGTQALERISQTLGHAYEYGWRGREE